MKRALDDGSLVCEAPPTAKTERETRQDTTGKGVHSCVDSKLTTAMIASRVATRALASAVLALVALTATCVSQDILRNHQRHNQHQHQRQQQQQQNEQLANLQLPPQLAQLTPQQLHQLAQIRELQIQQQQRQAAAAASEGPVAAPLPIGVEAAPAAGSSPQQSEGARPQAGADTGAYHEAGSELEGVDMSGGSSSGAGAPTATNAASASSGSSSTAPAPSFEVNWNKCPQLDPSESERAKKTQVITKCLQAAPIPQNLTRENVENHREQIATCALKVEGWFNEAGSYKYDKAEAEIRSKHLEPSIELQVLKFHVACKDEANKKFSQPQEKLIDQVQFYQACMDYYISIVCEIEVSVDQ